MTRVPLTPGERVGLYEVIALIGRGGMGEVYRARDTRLKRDVALKILPSEFSTDPERAGRFEREAELLASLNHPSIAGIYGFEKADDTCALVLELVEGETLADLMTKAPAGLPVGEALSLAVQIAGALEAAHEKGVIHRDLKPANIAITPEGRIKVLDFGLAKAFEPASAAAVLTHSPTLTLHATGAGVILGTASYMSPEQARGRAVDKRGDIFSFGAVLYEMLTGRQAFPGGTITEILACVIEREPDWLLLPPLVEPRIGELLRRCLEKDPAKRRRDIGDVRLEIERVLAAPAHISSEATGVTAPKVSRLAWTVAGVMTIVAAIAAAAFGALYVRRPIQPPEMRLDIVTPLSPSPASFAVSPDGQRVVYVAFGDAQARLWVRLLNASSAEPLQGTEGATFPFWSPDSRSIGFFTTGKLKRVDLGGGLPQTLADAPNARGGTWGDGTILFATTGSPLRRVPASGGDIVAVTKLEGQGNHRFPQFLPGGRQFLFSAQGGADSQGVYVARLDGAGVKRVLAADTVATYVSPGWLLYVSQGTLFARRFDIGRGELSGEPITVANPATGMVSASSSGLIAYRSQGVLHQQLTWFDRSGRPIEKVGAIEDTGLSHPELSPDGRRIAVSRTVQGNTDVWIVDGSRMTRFTFEPGIDHGPIWSPDGSRIAFDSGRTNAGGHQFFWKPSSGTDAEAQLITPIPGDKGLDDWSADGKFILYATSTAKSAYDLEVLPLDGDRMPRPFLSTPFTEQQGQFSPDGRWVAYQSNESGQFEIYVRPFPGPGGQWQVSTTGGISPRWRHDGKELYYLSPAGQLMAAAVAASAKTFASEAPVVLFNAPVVNGGTPGDFRPQYDVAADGRFLINTIVDQTVAPITLLLHWTPTRDR
jgi:Tol biopolymer transport system component